MTDTHEPFWQDMLAEPAKKFNAIQGHDFLQVVAVVTPAETNPRFADIQEPVVADSYFMCVSSKILYNLLRPVVVFTLAYVNHHAPGINVG